MKKSIKKEVIRRLTNPHTRMTTGTLCRLGKGGHHAYCVMGLVGRSLGIKPQELAGKTEFSEVDTDDNINLYELAGITGGFETTLIGLNDKDDNEIVTTKVRKSLIKAIKKA